MMMIPVLAYMIRSLIEEGKDDKVANRADLYKRFVDHLIHGYKHEEIHLTEHGRQQARQLLQRVSFKALARADAFLSRVPLEFCSKHTSAGGVTVDELFKVGFADLVIDTTAGLDKLLCFSHQSFQEYFAAEWASQSEDRVASVLSEYWSPKWREVIKFLAGMIGTEVVSHVLSEDSQDDPVRTRLFLAAECSGETRVSTDLEHKLIDTLCEFVHKSPFDRDSVYSLAQMHTQKAGSVAWDMLLRGIREDGWNAENVQGQVLSPVLSDRRLQWVRQQIAGEDPRLGLSLLRMVPDYVSEEDVECALALADSKDGKIAVASLLLLSSVSERLRRHHVRSLLKKASELCPYVTSIASILKSVSCGFDDDDVDLILRKCAESRSPFLDFGQVLASPVFINCLNLEQLEWLFNLYWGDRGGKWDRLAYPETGFPTRLSDEHISQILKKLDDHDPEVVQGAIWMLQGLWNRLGNNDIERLMKLAGNRALRPFVIWSIAPVSHRLTGHHRAEILGTLIQGDPHSKHAVMLNLDCFRADIQQEHIDAVTRAMEEYACIPALRACLLVANRLDNVVISKVIRTIVGRFHPHAVGLLRYHQAKAIATSISPYLDKHQNHLLVEELLSECDSTGALRLELINPRALNEEDILSLVSLLDRVEEEGFQRVLYSLLQAVARLGLFERDEAQP
jgi:hypothetical protein